MTDYICLIDGYIKSRAPEKKEGSGKKRRLRIQQDPELVNNHNTKHRKRYAEKKKNGESKRAIQL